MKNRSLQPEITNSFSLELMEFRKFVLENGCILYHFPYEIQPVAKVEFLFQSGKKYQSQPLTASFAGKMLMEGTSRMDQKQIATEFDILGARVNIETTEDITRLSVFSTTRNITEVLLLVHHILTDSTFPQEQLDILSANSKQTFLNNLKKVGYLAQQELFISLFTNEHPYTRFPDVSDFENVSRIELKQFLDAFYDLSRAMIVWTGSMSDLDFSLCTNLFGTNLKTSAVISEPLVSVPDDHFVRINTPLNDASQSAICIGKIFPGLHHPDTINLTILTTILGGYFGSRLMKNLREDKGYTYGIRAGLYHFEHVTVFFISTQVNAEQAEEAILEINNEIMRLQNENISSDELEIVQNYMSGTLLQGLDGPFAQSRYIINLIRHKTDAREYLQKFSNSIRQITPETIKYLTQKYLQKNELTYSVSGKFNNNQIL